MTAYLRPISIAALSMLLAACGSDGANDSENYGNILNSPAGLILVEEEHQTGYGRPDCLVCHNTNNIHTVNRTGLPSCDEVTPPASCIDLDEVQAIVSDGGQSSCALCHGTNGVLP
jgi:hypothetical protein